MYDEVHTKRRQVKEFKVKINSVLLENLNVWIYETL